MTSVPTDIDNDRSYVFMSSGLEEEIYLDDGSAKSSPIISVRVGKNWEDATFVFLERESEDSFTVCVSSNGLLQGLVRSLLIDELVEISIDNVKFKSRVSKLESNRSYLKVSR